MSYWRHSQSLMEELRGGGGGGGTDRDVLAKMMTP